MLRRQPGNVCQVAVKNIAMMPITQHPQAARVAGQPLGAAHAQPQVG